MIKKTIAYEDFDGNELIEDFWFHLSKAELLDLEMRTGEGLEAYGLKLIAATDKRELIALFKEILLMSFGVRDPNNAKRFIKSEQLSKEFSETNAFVELYVELFQAENMVEFFKGVIPKLDQAKQQVSVPIGRVELPVQETDTGLVPKFNLGPIVYDQASHVRDLARRASISDVTKLSDYTHDQVLTLSGEEFKLAKDLETEFRRTGRVFGANPS